MAHADAAPHLADRIDLRADEEVHYWTQTLHISEEELRRTIADVGDDVEAVCERHPR
jgi:hypothetical protein